MKKLLSRGRPSPAMVIAMIALFCAIGGAAFAAGQITGRQVRDNSLTGRDIRNNSLNTRDIRNNSLRGGDIANGTIRAGDLARGVLTRGPAGPRGVPGAPGAPGADGATGPTGPASPVNPTEFGVAKVFAGTTALGTVWSPDIPDDRNNAAQASGTIGYQVPTGGGGRTIDIRAVIRTDENDGSGNPAGSAGAFVLIRDETTGLVVDYAVTDPNPAYGGVQVVNLDGVPKASSGPSPTDTPLVATLTIPASVADGDFVTIQGTAQFFDFQEDPSNLND